MTPRQIKLARHALGLHASCLVSRRNALVMAPGDPGFTEWEAMVAGGFATSRALDGLGVGWSMFRLTRAGAEAVLLPGERLDPEDWP